MLQIIYITAQVLKDFKQNAWFYYKEKSIEWNIWRYFLQKHLKYLPQTDINGIPLFEKNFFWSLSHKENLIFIGWDKKEIWIDIEILKPRNEEIFLLHSDKEYKLLWEKNLIHFYILWTLKESIIKVFLSSIDILNEIKILNMNKKKERIDNFLFEYHFTWTLQNIWWKWSVGVKNNIIYAICKKI